MTRPIYTSPRFTLPAVFLTMAGLLVLEFTVALLLNAAASVASYVVALVSSGRAGGDSSGLEAGQLIVAKIVSFFVVMYFVRLRTGESWSAFGRLRFPPRLLLAPVALIAGVSIFLSELDNLMRAFAPPYILDRWDFAPQLGDLIATPWTGPVLAVLVAPFAEEFIFRGVILRGLLARWGARPAILVSALLFAAMHLNPAQLPVTLALGLLLGWTFVRTRSLGLCILLHGLNNASGYLVDFLPFEIPGFNSSSDTDAVVFQPWWFDLLGLAFFVAGIWVIRRFAIAEGPWQSPPAVAPAHSEPPLLEPPLLEPPLLVCPADALGICQTAKPADSAPAMSAELASLVTSLAQRARAASLVLATAPTAAKDAALARLADLIDASHAPLLAANEQDLASPEAFALSAASRERLTLTPAKLTHLAQSVREVIALPDPVGTELEAWTRPNGLRIRKLRVPIGVIGIIYESRPNVTVDCAILCLKSGNACILRGGKECFHTNTALVELIRRALTDSATASADGAPGAPAIPADAVQLVPTTDRAALNTLLKLDTLIHCIIPRGGESLIRYVAQNSTIPVIKHYTGVCFVYVDRDADPDLAEPILLNAKTQRPGVCNAAEQLLVHADVAETLLPRLAGALLAKNVQLRCDPASADILARANLAQVAATPADFTAEFLDLIIAIRVVDSLETAIATINRDGSAHSDTIVTRDEAAARRFQAGVDSAAVFWNASTRFNDGFEFGYGAEIGISTDRLHARGPMGLRELCSYKFVIDGTGQVRG